MRCYFNLVCSRDRIDDDDGIEVSDPSALTAQATQAILELLEEQDPREAFQEWKLEVTDAAGTILMVVPFEHAFSPGNAESELPSNMSLASPIFASR